MCYSSDFLTQETLVNGLLQRLDESKGNAWVSVVSLPILKFLESPFGINFKYGTYLNVSLPI